MDLQKIFDIDYKTLFDQLGLAYYICATDDPTFTVIEENEAHAKIAMVKRKDVIGKPLFEVFPDTSDEYMRTGINKVQESLRKVLRMKKPDLMPYVQYDLKDTHGNLTQQYWRLGHYPIKDRDGKVTALCQLTENITESVLTEKELERTQDQLKRALSNGSIGTWTWDLTKEKVYADDNMAKIYGLTSQDVAKGVPLEVFINAIHSEDRGRVTTEINHAVETERSFESEYRTIDQEGNVRWVIARGRIEHNKKTGRKKFPGVAVDITERKNAENNLNFLTKASTQFSASLGYQETLNNIASMVVPAIADWCMVDVINNEGKLEQVAIVHKDPEKVAWAKSLRAAQGEPDMDASTGVPKVIKTGKPEFYPIITDEMLVASAKDEKELELLRSLNFQSVIITPLKIDNKIIGAISLISTESHVHYTDLDLKVAQGLANRAALAVYNANLYKQAQQEIEERERLQEQLEVANSILETRVQERTSQLVETNEGLEREIKKRTEAEAVLQEYGKNLARSNQELQDFAYVASHDLQEPLRKIQAFGDLLESEYASTLGEGQEYLARMRNAASRMSILIEDLLAFSRVTTKAQPEVSVSLDIIAAEVVSDLETRIAQTQGRVEVGPLPAVKADPTHMRQLLQNLISNALKFHKESTPPVVKVYAKDVEPKDTHYTIYVEDNGIGFEEKYLDRIFSVFQRLHGKEMYEGTGIGLAVCRKIVERYDGTITAESIEGKGSKFIITLPKHKKGIK